MWGSKYPSPEEWVRQRVTATFDRSYRPEGVARLIKAAGLTPGLWKAQTAIRCPTPVMHGGEDPFFSVDHGKAIAEKIPNATLWHDPNMGHIMHEQQWAKMAERIAAMVD